ncbi:glutamyl-tRNA synthetase [Natronospira proteinivora]|uniref:Glutamate--tRNA ligase n=1 Tax=Natronospira proteinivora TaxID=1807133 RepID=A0ABT1G840_9GAMM|nr:glutamate--tRNA ligase [Natronospira proteinivora]MCP1727090.1 glutamyl-tRNA synthetase [Natronospira proteinivora]
MNTQPTIPQPVTRFAPSPTGHIHLGNARTALFNALYATGQGGQFMLRVEDTDAERSRDEFLEALMRDLRWLGLDWQLGHDAGGDQGPYRQSRRQAIYERYFTQLQEQGLSYPCFCSKEQLKLSRQAQRAAGKPPRYAGTCARLDPAEAQRRLDAGEPASWRFRVPSGQRIEFEDFVRGPQHFATDDIGDFVIRRTDGTPAFFFSNAVDDALMGVSHVMRGEDHLTNTPRQLMLLEALGLPTPAYGHLPLIADSDGGPLSKRAGSLGLRDLRREGYLPLAILNYMARLGHRYDEEERLRSLVELARDFDVARVGKAPARYDAHQLLYWQKQAVAELDTEAAWNWMADAVSTAVPPGKAQAFATLIKPNVTFPEQARDWAHRLFNGAAPMDEAAKAVIEESGRDFFETALDALEATGLDYTNWTQRIRQLTGAKGKKLFLPLRVALTGQRSGPDLDGVLALIGQSEAMRRLERCISLS